MMSRSTRAQALNIWAGVASSTVAAKVALQLAHDELGQLGFVIFSHNRASCQVWIGRRSGSHWKRFHLRGVFYQILEGPSMGSDTRSMEGRSRPYPHDSGKQTGGHFLP